MGSLQRSTKSFRRQGSSGSVWDDNLLSEEVKQLIKKEGGELRPCHSIGGMGMMMMINSEDDIGANVGPTVYTRSLSAPATKDSSSTTATSKMVAENGFVGACGKPPTSGKSKSGKKC
ncbi:hypothetical protein LguiB_027678 [Lonicera macranthoides]